ncbi:uncharacterized protein C2845_PM15G21380 [Panicum miliaceum]|uniref:Transposase MuDR plant domain-containing protein n=1 Tax=Panicum miliaceum TaxID=4540 RepID=A0A3L6QAG2_PANMI|nr:uncharacterized protein C2845_PM15G21380 [Panicum miliaceum]
MHDFRMALRQHAIKNEFEVHKVVTNKTRYRDECKAEGCNWRIVARKLPRQSTVVILMIPCGHDCMSSSKLVNSMASQKWIAEKAVAWKAPSKPKNKTVKPKTVPVVNISPGSITRRRISLLQGGQEYAQGSSTITNPVKRLLVLSQEGGATSSSGIK